MSREQAGHWLRFWRQEAGLTQREVAAAIELGAYTKITNFEFGRAQLPYRYFPAYADALAIDLPTFARKLLSGYEPELYRCLFGDDDDRSTPREMRDRITQLEKAVSRLSGKVLPTADD